MASRHIHAGSLQSEGMSTSIVVSIHEAKFADVSLNSNGSSSQRPCVLSRVPSARARISPGRTGEVGWSGGFFLCWAFYPIAAWTVMHVFTPSIVPSTDSLIKSSPSPDPASRRAAEQTSARTPPARAPSRQHEKRRGAGGLCIMEILVYIIGNIRQSHGRSYHL